MFSWIDVYRLNYITCEMSSLLSMTFFKGLVVFTVVCLLNKSAKKLSPAHRHLFWFFAVGSVAVIPVLSIAAPQFHLLDAPFFVNKKAAIERTISMVSPRIGYATRLPAYGVSSSGNVTELFPVPRLSWAFYVICAWAAGAVCTTYLVLVGFFQLYRLTRRAKLPKATRISSLLEDLKTGFDIKRRVRVLLSGEVRIPFACYTARPTVVLPMEAVRWSKGRILAVLTHELAHVKRFDFLTRAISRIVCSLFWPAPFVWVSHSYLHAEQEKACDLLAVSAGETPSTYAGHLVTLARAFVGERSLAAGIFLAGVNISSLEKRIVAILNTTRETLNTRFLYFLKPFGVCLLLALPLLFLHTAVGEIVGKAIERDAASGRFQGTWVNETISGDVAEDPEPQKYVITPDMTVESWQQADQQVRSASGALQLVENWVGTDGFLYGRAYVVSESPLLRPTTELWRIDPTGTKLEKMWRLGIQKDFPPAVDPRPEPGSPDRYCMYSRR